MSCYIVDENVIDYLVYNILNTQGTYNFLKTSILKDKELTPTKIGRILLKENVKSYACRYEENIHPNWYDSYEYDKTKYFEREGDGADLLQVLASIRHYEYQACEHPRYNNSRAKKVIKALQSAVIIELTENKVWGSPEPLGVKKNVIQ
jgi:hypothetical protein